MRPPLTSPAVKITARPLASQETVTSIDTPGNDTDLKNVPPCPSLKKIEMAWPGLLPAYHTFPGPFATQQGALFGYGGVGPLMGKTFRFASTIAKLSGL